MRFPTHLSPRFTQTLTIKSPTTTCLDIDYKIIEERRLTADQFDGIKYLVVRIYHETSLDEI